MTQVRCEFFRIHELVSDNIFKRFGGTAWEFFNPRALITLDQIRRQFGPIMVNNWSDGGHLKYRGFRELACKIGKDQSQHRFGNAFDCSCINTGSVTADEMREYILANPEKFRYLTAIEKDVAWLHFDCRNNDIRNSDYKSIAIF